MKCNSLDRTNGESRLLALTPELDPGHDAPDMREKLEELDLSENQLAAVLEIVENETQREAFHHAAAVLRRVFAHVSRINTAGAALVAALGCTDKSLAELAGNFGRAKQSVGNYLPRMTAALGPLARSKAGSAPSIVRPVQEGEEYLTVVEAAKVTGRTAGAIQAAAKTGQLSRRLSQNQAFYRESELLAWSEKLAIDAAGIRYAKRIPPICQTANAAPLD